MKKIVIFLLGMILTIGATAQSYRSALGIKIAYDAALTYKVNVSEANAIDLNLSLTLFQKGFFGVAAQGFYLWSFPIVDNLACYVGPGASIGLGIGTYSDGSAYSAFNLMFNCEFGLEYKLPTSPIAFSFDWTPGIGLAGSGFGYNYYGGGLGIKYTF